MNALNTTFGRYRLLEPLGRGGMAEVFKAKSYGVEGFEKVVVIKRILPELAQSEQFVEMFIHEAKLAVRLSHANIVQVFDLGIAPAHPPAGHFPGADPGSPEAYYMAMEYVSGLDLATLLARCRRGQIQIPIEMAVYVAAEVAKGLDHAHRRRDEQNQPLGIVHLDVSPQNVLLSLEGEVKVTDFGIAKARGALESTDLADTRARQLQGKFGYVSPEHAAGDVVDARSDLFSLGTVLYEMCSGANPFVAPTSFETLRRVQSCEYPPVELLRPDMPPELIALVQTAMSKRPDDRFSDAGRMYEALLAFLYSQGRRFSAHDLGEFLGRFRSPEETGQHVILDAEGLPSQERTPVEIPASRRSASHRVEPTVVDVTALGERREVTALVVTLPSRDGSITDRAAEIVLRYGGRIVWREPESLSALFGVDDPDGRDTEIATRCALVVLRAFPGTSTGLHTGRIHVSSEGAPTEDERLTGLVSIARDLSRVREGLCAISAAAMRQVRNLFVFDTLTAGNEGGSSTSTLIVREVRGASEAVGRFVGRKDELRAVGEMLATATRRSACALTLRGDHGTGKTRLLLEVERRLRKGGYNVGFYLATCLPRGTEVPYSGLQCMLQVLCGITEGDPEPRIRQVIPRLRALGLPDDEVNAILSVLGASGASAKAALASGFRRMVQRLCEDRPHAFAWDAADCLDADSYGVLETVMSRANSARVVLLFATRAGYTHPIESTGLDLGDLKPDDAEKLVAVRLGVERVPPELMRFVRDRAGGHPQMIEEMLKALVEARAVTVADGSVLSMKLVGQDLALPKTLRGLVGSRISRLDAPERAVLQAASILGEPVNATVLARMMGIEMGALEKSLATLKDRGFLVHIGPVELQFTSPIVREVVVDALTAEAALAMHAAAGRALETEPGDHTSRIATHLYAAGERERAAGYFGKSAERRLATGQYETAMRDFSRAIELCEPSARSPSELAGWLAGLAKAVRLVRAAPEALEMCERVITRVDQAGELEAKVTTRIDAGRILGALHLYDAARAQFTGAEAIAQDRPELVKSALVAAAELSGRQGDFKRSLGMLERLESIVTTAGDRAEEHKLVVSLVQTHAAMGDHPAALKHFDRLAGLVKDEPTAVCERHKLSALISFFARDFRAAALHSEKAIDLARELGLQYEVAVNLHNLADILVHSSDFPRAYGAVQQSLALCDDLGFERLSSHNRMVLAYLDGLKGDAEADKVVLQGIRYAEANDFTWDVLGGRLLLAKLLEHRGDLDGARLGYQKLRELARGAGNRLVADECAEALRSMGAPALSRHRRFAHDEDLIELVESDPGLAAYNGRAVNRSSLALVVLAISASGMAGCEAPSLAQDGTLVFPQGGARGASVLTANGVEYRDRNDIPQPIRPRSADEPWRAPIGFILPKDGRFTKAASPTVLATTGLAIVMRPSDTRVPSWGGEVLVRVDIIAPAAEGTARYGENVAIVIDGEGKDAAELADVALAQLAGRDRVTIIDAHGAKVLVPLMPASNRSMAIAALKHHLKNTARPAKDTAKALDLAGTTIAGHGTLVTERVLVLSDGQPDAKAIARLTEHGVQVAQVSTVSKNDDFQDRAELVRNAIPQAGLTAFRDVRLTFEGTPAPSHVLEVSGGEARWSLDAGVLVVGNVRAGEARTEMVRVSVPSWVPNEEFRFTVTAHVDDLAWGGPRDFAANVPCIYDDDIERIAKSRHGDVIAYASAMATLKRLDAAFIGEDVEKAGGLRKIAQLHAESMQALARDTKDFAVQEQADLLTALLRANP